MVPSRFDSNSNDGDYKDICLAGGWQHGVLGVLSVAKIASALASAVKLRPSSWPSSFVGFVNFHQGFVAVCFDGKKWWWYPSSWRSVEIGIHCQFPLKNQYPRVSVWILRGMFLFFCCEMWGNVMWWDGRFQISLFCVLQKKICLEPDTATLKWLFQLDDSKSLHEKWLFHQTSIKKWLFGVPGEGVLFEGHAAG